MDGKILPVLSLVIAETVCFGAFTSLIVLCVIVHLRHGFQSYLKTLMGLFCVVMYAIAMAHWTLTIRRMSYDATVLQNAINNGIMSVEDDAIIFGNDSILCAATPLLTVNVIIGDIIVLWRACCIWSGKRSIQVISGVLVVTTLVMSCISASINCYSDAGFEQQIGTGAFLLNVYGHAAIILTWVTNVWATTLVTCKAWHYRKIVARDLRVGNVRMRMQKVLMLFIELGIFYCAIWSALVAAVVITLLSDEDTDLLSNRLLQCRQILYDIMKSGLIDIIGMYPTIVVISVALTQSYCERTILSVHLSRHKPAIQLNAPNANAYDIESETNAHNVLDIERHQKSESSSSVNTAEDRSPAGRRSSNDEEKLVLGQEECNA